MEAALHSFRVSGHVVWPVRPNAEKVTRVVEVDGARYVVSLQFPSRYFITKEIRLANMSWSQVAVHWRQRFSGTRAQGWTWAASKSGGEALLAKIERAQNAFVDVIKNEFKGNYDIHCVRHFGPLDWPFLQVSLEGRRVFERIGSSLGSHFRSTPTVLESLPSICQQVSYEERTLQRAVDLSQCGYPTESALLAAGVLDEIVQKLLTALMTRRMIRRDSAEQLLRNVMTRRMATYLDAVLKLASGRSLAEDEPALFARMVRVNANRNDAIHNGRELTRSDAYEACNVVHEIAAYLAPLSPGFLPTLAAPTFFM